jgi:hypothetical protein
LDLQTEQGDTKCQQEGLQQGVDWAEDADVLHQRPVPKETQDERQDNDVQDEDGQVVQEVLGVAGSENGKHFNLCGENKMGACCMACAAKKPCSSTAKKTLSPAANAAKKKAVALATLFRWDPWGSMGRHHDNCYDYAFGLNNQKAVNKNVPGNMAGNKAWGLTFTNCNGIAKRVLEDYRGLAYRCKPSDPCPPGYYKVMNFVAPNGGDFHWYRETNAVRYRTRPGDTVTGLARFFRVTPAIIRAAVAKGTRPTSASNGRISNNVNRNLPVLNQMVHRGSGAIRPGKVIQFPVRLWSHKQGFATGPVLVDASGKTIADPRRANRAYPGLNYSKFCSAYMVKAGAGRAALARSRSVTARANGLRSLGILRR